MAYKLNDPKRQERLNRYNDGEGCLSEEIALLRLLVEEQANSPNGSPAQIEKLCSAIGRLELLARNEAVQMKNLLPFESALRAARAVAELFNDALDGVLPEKTWYKILDTKILPQLEPAVLAAIGATPAPEPLQLTFEEPNDE